MFDGISPAPIQPHTFFRRTPGWKTVGGMGKRDGEAERRGFGSRESLQLHTTPAAPHLSA